MSCDCYECTKAAYTPSLAVTMASITFKLNCILIMLELKRIERERSWWS